MKKSSLAIALACSIGIFSPSMTLGAEKPAKTAAKTVGPMSVEVSYGDGEGAVWRRASAPVIPDAAFAFSDETSLVGQKCPDGSVAKRGMRGEVSSNVLSDGRVLLWVSARLDQESDGFENTAGCQAPTGATGSISEGLEATPNERSRVWTVVGGKRVAVDIVLRRGFGLAKKR